MNGPIGGPNKGTEIKDRGGQIAIFKNEEIVHWSKHQYNAQDENATMLRVFHPFVWRGHSRRTTWINVKPLKCGVIEECGVSPGQIRPHTLKS